MAFHNNPRIVTEDLIGCWDANMKSSADSGAKLYDRVGSTDATLYNGSCLDFDGTNDYVTNTSFTGHQSSSGTIVAWAKADSLAGDKYVFGVGGTTTYGSNRTMRLYLNKLSLVSYGSGTEDYNDFGPTLVTGQWYHFAYVWSGTSVTGYVDGVGYSTTLSGLVTPTGTNVTAGQAPWGGNYFNGQVADARVYNVALSAANIKELYQDSKVIIPSSASQTNLKGWWPLADGAGTIAYDGSGYGNDGTLTNMVTGDWLTGQAGPPQLVTGYNRPLLGDGATDLWVNFGDPSTALDIGTGTFTLGYWINPKSITGNYIGHVTLTASATAARFEVAFYGSTIRVYTTNGSWNNTGYAPTLNKWTHILFKRYSNSITMHVNGSSSATWTLSSSVTLGPWTVMKMMHHSTGTTYASFDGLLNEVVFYDAAIGNAEMAKLATKDASGRPMPPNPQGGGSDMMPTANLKGYWRNDGDVTWKDLSGNGNHGTVTNSNGTILLREGYAKGRDIQGFPLSRQNNGAIGFDGTTTYADVGSVGGAGTFSNCTISVWVNPRNIVGATTHGRIYDGNYEPSIRQRGPTLQLNGAASTSTYRFYLGADISNYFSAGNMTAPHDQWTNVTMTVTTVGTTLQSVKGYVNLNYEGSGSTTDSSKMWVGDIGNLRIGQGYKTGQRFFTGQIGNLQIWDRVLSLAEITQNYNAHRARFGR